jgi:hypothetical protein
MASQVARRNQQCARQRHAHAASLQPVHVQLNLEHALRPPERARCNRDLEDSSLKRPISMAMG